MPCHIYIHARILGFWLCNSPNKWLSGLGPSSSSFVREGVKFDGCYHWEMIQSRHRYCAGGGNICLNEHPSFSGSVNDISGFLRIILERDNLQFHFPEKTNSFFPKIQFKYLFASAINCLKMWVRGKSCWCVCDRSNLNVKMMIPSLVGKWVTAITMTDYNCLPDHDQNNYHPLPQTSLNADGIGIVMSANSYNTISLRGFGAGAEQ